MLVLSAQRAFEFVLVTARVGQLGGKLFFEGFGVADRLLRFAEFESQRPYFLGMRFLAEHLLLREIGDLAGCGLEKAAQFLNSFVRFLDFIL